jgi:hypothetical protein
MFVAANTQRSSDSRSWYEATSRATRRHSDAKVFLLLRAVQNGGGGRPKMTALRG